ncbi:L7Ae/L30e/S12e/Gadd45 family ribosomal protein [Sporosalibacterium faouarense]|uniref:L7Ae/L30e/S12e/Gadd45 family ribosomal protein n=1 Tax=Sporosalibacterium faouarense TaxID=516123 RepID=UPI00141C65C8|nr:ribosomal L7Ae/L30e/S12e/Gadd45 family protein [Sporosalibacterium faouarense]MTI48037.1 50S ribosomal protein L7ae [Bacillota bacterium]
MNKVYSMLGLGRKAGYIVSGETGCIQEVKRNKSHLIIIAEDSSANTKKKFTRLCENNDVKYAIFGKKEDLGSAIGKELTAILSIGDEKFSQVILDMLA